MNHRTINHIFSRIRDLEREVKRLKDRPNIIEYCKPTISHKDVAPVLQKKLDAIHRMANTTQLHDFTSEQDRAMYLAAEKKWLASKYKALHPDDRKPFHQHTMNKIKLKQLFLDYAIYNIERSLTQHADRTDRQQAELARLNIKCESILREATAIIDEL